MTPDELDGDGWVTGLGAEFKVPPVGATCSSGTGGLLDYFVASREIGGRLEVQVDLDGPWAPHRGLQATLKAAASAPMVWQLEEPRGIPLATGPDRTPFKQAFEQRVSEAPPAFALWDHPVESDSQSPDLTRKYSAFSRAAEDTLLGRGEQAEESRCKGRGLPLVFRWASQQKPNRQGSIYPERSPCFWGGARAAAFGIQAAPQRNPGRHPQGDRRHR